MIPEPMGPDDEHRLVLVAVLLAFVAFVLALVGIALALAAL